MGDCGPSSGKIAEVNVSGEMFFDLNVPLPTPGAQLPSTQAPKKGKQKQQQPQQQQTAAGGSTPPLVFTPAQIAAIEARIDLLVHLGYTVFALNQVVLTKVDGRTHVNWIQGLVPKLKKRHGVSFLKRLTVVLDDESDKGNGINPQNSSILAPYDIISLRPTTQASFSAACLSHSSPSPHTAHIISIPATLPRLPFHLKHTLVRTALKNGAVFELDYAGAVGVEVERRCWWGGAREVVRVTKGKGILVSGGAEGLNELRAPRDAANLITLLGIPQNLSHDALTITPKAVVLRAQSRKTYRSTLSEPKLVFPAPAAADNHTPDSLPEGQARVEAALPPSTEVDSETLNAGGGPLQLPPEDGIANRPVDPVSSNTAISKVILPNQGNTIAQKQGKKRQREDPQQQSGGGRKKKKKS